MSGRVDRVATEADLAAEVTPGMIEEVHGARLKTPARAVSVIVPAYNEGPHVAAQLRAVRGVLEATDWQYEIIVVDDGSSDGTGEAAAAAGVRVLRHRRNRGYGASLKRGIEAAGHEWILIIDADGTYPPDAIPALLEKAASHDMVVGARTGETVRVPFARRPAKWFLGRLASYLAEQELPDINSGLRLIDRRLVESYLHLLPDGFSFTTTITLAATVNGYEVGYVPISYHARLGDSKIRPRHAYDFTLLILRTIVYFNPLRVFIPMGVLLALAGLAKFAYDVVIGNLSESAVLALLGALIIWAVGLLADQNARILRRR